MKIVFKITGTALLAVALLGTPNTARADGAMYFSTRELLADFFRTSQSVTFKKVTLGSAELGRIQSRLGYTPARSTYTFYVAQTKGEIDGYALIDDEKGQHLPITFAVKISPAGVVLRQEIVAYREARGDEVRDESFRKQFVGKTADSAFSTQDIVAISGATISSTAMAVGVKRALVLFDELVRRRPGQLASAAHPAL